MFIARLSKEFFTYLKVLVIFTLLLPVHGISGAFAQEDVTDLDAAHTQQELSIVIGPPRNVGIP